MKRRLLFERSKLEALKKKKNNLVKLRIDTAFKHRYIVDIFLIPLEHLIEKQEKSINFIKKKIKSIKDNKLSNNDNYPKDKRIEIDIDEIKRIPIRLILERAGIEILRNNFFKIRNEDTPSAQFNEDKNLWVDYGNANQGGSVIDLYMKLYGVNVADAIKELSLYL